jgi:hypothetical protein
LHRPFEDQNEKINSELKEAQDKVHELTIKNEAKDNVLSKLENEI